MSSSEQTPEPLGPHLQCICGSQVASERPAFVHVGLVGWDAYVVNSKSQLKGMFTAVLR